MNNYVIRVVPVPGGAPDIDRLWRFLEDASSKGADLSTWMPMGDATKMLAIFRLQRPVAPTDIPEF